ncbi:hypothetical protein D3C83_49820 [compost metagenome]
MRAAGPDNRCSVAVCLAAGSSGGRAADWRGFSLGGIGLGNSGAGCRRSGTAGGSRNDTVSGACDGGLPRHAGAAISKACRAIEITSAQPRKGCERLIMVDRMTGR